jgi:hypothetical protein
MPLKEGLMALRQKGASLRLIRELLVTVDVAVGTDTIAWLLAQGNASRKRSELRRRLRCDRRVRGKAAQARSAAALVSTVATARASTSPQSQSSEPRKFAGAASSG